MAGVAPEQALCLFMHSTEVHRSKATSRDASPTFPRPVQTATNRLHQAKYPARPMDSRCLSRPAVREAGPPLQTRSRGSARARELVLVLLESRTLGPDAPGTSRVGATSGRLTADSGQSSTPNRPQNRATYGSIIGQDQYTHRPTIRTYGCPSRRAHFPWIERDCGPCTGDSAPLPTARRGTQATVVVRAPAARDGAASAPPGTRRSPVSSEAAPVAKYLQRHIVVGWTPGCQAPTSPFASPHAQAPAR